MTGSLLLHAAGRPDGRVCDLRIVAGRIAAIAERLDRLPGEPLLDVGGGVVMRGLHDHHIHLLATARALESVPCGPPSVCDPASLARALQAARPSADGWVRGVGFHDSVVPGMDRHWLDRVHPRIPVRIQQRSGMLWILNTAALTALGLFEASDLPPGIERLADGTPSGRCYALDDWLGERLGAHMPDLHELGVTLARYGVTGVTDAGVRNGPAEWGCIASAQARGELPQRVLMMGSEALGGYPGSGERLARGALKIYLRESDFDGFDMIADRVRVAHAMGRAVAIHCVTRAELVVALAALERAGARCEDRIEHAAICDDEALAWIVRLGIRVVSQPHFIAERGDRYREEVAPEDQRWLWRAAAFRNAGIPFAAGTDAPYGLPDPWTAMRNAVRRCTIDGHAMGAEEALSPGEVLGLFHGDPWAPGSGSPWPVVGDRADLCVLDLPWRALLGDLDACHVRATLIAGVIVYQRDG